ncbi:Stage V sporulation protein K [Talaromyces pinophilus]|nr:Stage V sporulation protein K [Talaromyces pinophilus]
MGDAGENDQSDSPSTLKVPDWFLKYNVGTPDEPSQPDIKAIEFNDTATRLSQSQAPSLFPQGSQSSGGDVLSPTTICGIDRAKYSELRDIITGALVQDNVPKRSYSQQPSILLRALTAGNYDDWALGFLDSILVHIAGEIGASLISVDLDDLHHIAIELSIQDGEDQARLPTFPNILDTVFGIRCEKHQSFEDIEKNARFISAILDAPKLKSIPQNRASTGNLREMSPEERPPVFLLFRDAKRSIVEVGRTTKILRTFRTAVQKLRGKGEPIIFFATMSVEKSASENSDYYERQLCKKILVDSTSTVDLVPSWPVERNNSEASRIRNTNLLKLKRTVRRKFRPGFSFDLLSPGGVSWDEVKLQPLFYILEKEVWSDNICERVARQVVGRTWGKNALDIDDICEVIARLDNSRNSETEKLTQDDSEADTIRIKEGPSQADISTTDSAVVAEEPTSTNEGNNSSIEDNPMDCEVDPGPGDDPKAWISGPSKAREEWQYQKTRLNERNSTLDVLMNMIGLEAVKAKFMEIKNLVDTARRQGVNLKKERFGAVFIGNPGTGKTTIARLYGQFISSLGIVPAERFVEVTGARLANRGMSEYESTIERLKDDDSEPAGVVFVDEAYQLTSNGSSQVLEHILGEIERLQGNVAFVFAGYGKQMESFLGSKPGLRSRIPFLIKFDDYEDVELHQILLQQLKEKFNNKMRVEGGLYGLYMRIVVRRIGRGRGRSGFGNAREVQNVLLHILFRQASRLSQRRQANQEADDFFLTRADLIGPPPSEVVVISQAWKDLQALIGLRSVKDAVQALIDRLQENYNREIAEQPLVESSLNKVFLGNPGTGKTTVAKLYGQILADLALLSSGEVVVKNPSDFIGDHLGSSENITTNILESTRGKVLIIDEAYGLWSTEGTTRFTDSYRTAVIDTLVAQVQSKATEDRCILLLGYRERMEMMFQNVNPAFGRRFPLSSAFVFEDYTDEELSDILELKLRQQGFAATEEAKQVAMEVLSRARNHRNFGNAGEVDIILDRAKESQQKRLSTSDGENDPFLLVAQDFDADFDRGNRAMTRIREIFRDFVGANSIVEKLEKYQRITQNAAVLDINPRSLIPFNFLFKGPPGTGKTTTARRMGQIYYNMGYLATTDVVECSATDIIGEYVGHTGPKIRKIFEQALGKVLFIDEAYGLADSWYGRDAATEMANILTNDKYQNKLVTILAGYDEDINRLLEKNQGLSSRFPEVINFPPLSPTHCCGLLFQLLEAQDVDTSTVQAYTIKENLHVLFEELACLPAWGNGRDVQALAKGIFGRIISSTTSLQKLRVTEQILYSEINQMIDERQQRTCHTRPANRTEFWSPDFMMNEQQIEPTTLPIRTQITKSSVLPQSRVEELLDTSENEDMETESREPGVSDEIWNKLKENKARAKERAAAIQGRRSEIERLKNEVADQEKILRLMNYDSSQAQILRRELAKKQAKLEEKQRDQKKAVDDQKREDKVKEALMQSGVCNWGCEWIKEDSGWRCSAGACFVSDEEMNERYGIS